MQARADGEYYPVAGYDYSSPVYSTQMYSTSTVAGITPNACTQNSISNPMALAATGAQAGSFNFSALPPPPPPPNELSDPIKQNIYKSLHAIKEKPKTYGRNIYDNESNNVQAVHGQAKPQAQVPGIANNKAYANPGYKSVGSGIQATTNQPYVANQSNAHQAVTKQGYGTQAVANQGNQAYKNQTYNSQGHGTQDVGNQGVQANKNQAYNSQGQGYAAKPGFNKQGPDGQGFGGNQGFKNQGVGNQGWKNQGYGNEGFKNQGFNRQGGGNEGYTDQGYGNQGFKNQGYNKQGYGNDQGYGNQGFGNQGFGNQGYKNQEHGNQGFKPQGYGNQGYNKNQGFNKQGYGGNDQGYGNQGHNNQGFKNQRFNKPGFENQGPNKQGFKRYNDDSQYNQSYNNQSYNYPSFNEQGYNKNEYNRGYENHGYDDQNFNKPRYNNERFGNQSGFKWQDKKKPVKKPAVEQPPLEQTVPDLLDATLPKDLKLMFQPLFCKLCSAQLSSNQTAKMHYKSKNHEKKIRKWLTDYAETSGEPLHKRAVAVEKKEEVDTEKNPSWFHCEVCDLDLTGQMHAESHYMGKNHQKALLGYKTPAGQGYYDKAGKWVRVKGQKSKTFDFEKGEDNFGVDFKKPAETAGTEEVVEETSSTGEPPAKKQKESVPAGSFYCQVCSINTTCQDQLDTHFKGQKHAKKLKLMGLGHYADQRAIIEEAAAVPTASSPPATETPPADPELAVYRTPSGDYYCPVCNLTTNAEPQFVQHMSSKGHFKKVAANKPKPSA